MSNDDTQEPVKVMLPSGYYVGGHGDPIARFDRKKPLCLVLHPDGTVTWETTT